MSSKCSRSATFSYMPELPLPTHTHTFVSIPMISHVQETGHAMSIWPIRLQCVLTSYDFLGNIMDSDETNLKPFHLAQLNRTALQHL